MANFAFWFLFGVGAAVANADNIFKEVVTNFTINVTKGRDVIIFGCNKKDLLETTKALLKNNYFVHPIKISNYSSNFTLGEILTRHSHARTNVILDCKCNGSTELLEMSSNMLYFNKTYQWLLWDDSNCGIETLLPPKLKYPGLNSQVTYVNQSDLQYTLWDVHSKGRHLGSPLELNIIATYNHSDGFTILQDINAVQGIKFRGQFNGLRLRGATVIDQDNITTNEQIERVLSRSSKDAGVAAFVKYHYDLGNLLMHRLNFTVNYRNARGWAGRLGNSRFRLGFLGIMQRNEADIGASGAFNRLSRFAEFDIIHQSWKFETGFLYLFTPDLDTHGKSGNFLAPFHFSVWIFVTGSLCAMNFVWRLIERVNEKCPWRSPTEDQRTQTNEVVRVHNETETGTELEIDAALSESKAPLDSSETSWSALSLKTFAAFCQQGMDPIPGGLPSRTIVLTVFLFSLVMYNYYTSSVVGGLLSSTALGPSTVEQIVSSPLKLSFEDIGYNKILFRERQNLTAAIHRIYVSQVLPQRKPMDLPVYTHVEEALPYLRKGYAFCCEVLDAYPEIARLFDAGEICDLRKVPGLLEIEVINWDNPKQSQYTEIFRVAISASAEMGLVNRALNLRRPKKPICQGLYRVFPIAISGVSSAFMMLGAGYIGSVLVMLVERKVYKMKSKRAIQK